MHGHGWLLDQCRTAYLRASVIAEVGLRTNRLNGLEAVNRLIHELLRVHRVATEVHHRCRSVQRA